jgi:hypothetical protein
MVRRVVQHRAVGTEHPSGGRVAESYGSLHDRVEHRLHVLSCAADHAQNLAGRRLLLERIRLALQRLRQALLELAAPWSVVLGGLSADRALSLGRTLPGLFPLPHRRLLASQAPHDRAATEGRLREGDLVGKSVGRILEHPRALGGLIRTSMGTPAPGSSAKRSGCAA